MIVLNTKTYYMCVGAIWGTGLTLIALMLVPNLKSLLLGGAA